MIFGIWLLAFVFFLASYLSPFYLTKDDVELKMLLLMIVTAATPLLNVIMFLVMILVMIDKHGGWDIIVIKWKKDE